MESLENFGVDAGPKGDDDIQLEVGSRDTEGGCFGVFDWESGELREYATGIVGDGMRVEPAYDAGREWL